MDASLHGVGGLISRPIFLPDGTCAQSSHVHDFSAIAVTLHVSDLEDDDDKGGDPSTSFAGDPPYIIIIEELDFVINHQ